MDTRTERQRHTPEPPDWKNLQKRGLLRQALRLLSCGLNWRRYRDQKAEQELRRAAAVAPIELKKVAEFYLDQTGTE